MGVCISYCINIPYLFSIDFLFSVPAGNTAKWKFQVATRNRLSNCMNQMVATEEESVRITRRHPSANVTVISSMDDGVKMRSVSRPLPSWMSSSVGHDQTAWNLTWYCHHLIILIFSSASSRHRIFHHCFDQIDAIPPLLLSCTLQVGATMVASATRLQVYATVTTQECLKDLTVHRPYNQTIQIQQVDSD